MAKMDKNTVPTNFTLGLAVVDSIPVIFFGLNCIIIGSLFSKVFISGAVICLLSGMAKVIWKGIVAVKKKNIWPLFLQMRILMPVGILLMLGAIINYLGKMDLRTAVEIITGFPSGLFFCFGNICLILMCIFAVRFDSRDIKANWIEQITNSIGQICFFIGIILLRL